MTALASLAWPLPTFSAVLPPSLPALDPALALSAAFAPALAIFLLFGMRNLRFLGFVCFLVPDPPRPKTTVPDDTAYGSGRSFGTRVSLR